MTALAHSPRPVAARAAWIGAAGVVGLAVSALGSSLLHLGRAPFVLVHTVAVGVFAVLFFHHTRVDPRAHLRRRTGMAVLVGLLFGAMLLKGVIDQPTGASPRGLELAAALAWYGLVYGSADAVLLTVIPVLAAARALGGVARRPGQAAALAASLLVTALYHVGFEEFHGGALLQPLIGNTLVTLGYLVTGNPVTPLLAHVIMHGAAVLHGMEATVQLPPHY